ncbi:hypothetical protein DXG03_009143 [Asterophora parasitica]|uniref:Uncharacterized protein n=1 Tax=Asterophora parasitica TaxID=117018 RepID=A0A9P7G400_9AGAR|nr:hypothetical protein DXG03_009143 [Asterophora parasitica]
MKIIRHRLGRRPELWAEAVDRPPKKKALLVGIQYERDEEGDEANVLRGPHRDVAEMMDLLIVVLVDTDDSGQAFIVFVKAFSDALMTKDLDHFRCNRPYVPWISKGKRRSDSQWNANVRRHALVVSRHVYQSKRVSSSSVNSRTTSIDQLVIAAPDYKKLSIRTKSLSLNSELETWYDSPSSPILRCTSPDSMWPCSGYCPPSSPKEANVISVAACKDDQLSWEDSDGASMTKALINILSAQRRFVH